jgi:hypothetical protein
VEKYTLTYFSLYNLVVSLFLEKSRFIEIGIEVRLGPGQYALFFEE